MQKHFHVLVTWNAINANWMQIDQFSLQSSSSVRLHSELYSALAGGLAWEESHRGQIGCYCHVLKGIEKSHPGASHICPSPIFYTLTVLLMLSCVEFIISGEMAILTQHEGGEVERWSKAETHYSLIILITARTHVMSLHFNCNCKPSAAASWWLSNLVFTADVGQSILTVVASACGG